MLCRSYGVIIILLIAIVGCGGSDGNDTTYQVGRTQIEWVDSKRADIVGPTRGEPRRLAAFVWYPADPTSNSKPGPWLDSATAAIVSEALGISTEMLDRVPSKSFIDAPVASGESRYPVILMSHGDGGNPLIYSTTAEYLASQGSIVVGISHTYNADFTIFKDGSVVPGVTEGSAGALLDSSNMTFNDYLSNFRVGSALSEFYSRDASSALDQLELLNASDNLFNDRMDLTRVGMFGHSFGGSHSFAALRRDSRIYAAADLDGTIFSDAFAEGAPRPFLVISEPTDILEAQHAEALAAAGFSDEEVATLAAQSFSSRRAFEASSRAFYVTAKKFLHSNFTDVGILAPLGFPQDNISTEIAPGVALDISNRLLSEFFDQELSGQRSTLLYQATPFDEVVVEVRE